jgi:putative GTP pyrophosphokinase
MEKNNTYQMNNVLQEYNEFIRPYNDAIKLVKIKLEALDSDYGHLHKHNPIHQIINRVKSLDSILNKLAKRGYPAELEYAKDYLTDIAGIRVITYYQQDVYEVVRALKSCLDIVKESDYIKKPKPSGYRSYHLIVVVPIHYLKGVEYYPVEVQIRTLTMDCWANIEHQLHYKTLKDEFSGEISEKFQEFSEELNIISLKMEAIYSEQKERDDTSNSDITLKKH